MVAPGRASITEPVFIEAPLPPPALPGAFRVGPRVWGFLARLVVVVRPCGGTGDTQAGGSAFQARRRPAGGRGADRQGDVLLLAHGFFNWMIGAELKRRGWRLIENRGYRYWSVRRYAKG